MLICTEYLRKGRKGKDIVDNLTRMNRRSISINDRINNFRDYESLLNSIPVLNRIKVSNGGRSTSAQINYERRSSRYKVFRALEIKVRVRDPVEIR